MTTAVHFGAGNIGRGFIADLLHDSGYHVTFLDVTRPMVDEINRAGSLTLRLIEHGYEVKVIDNVDAIALLDDPDQALTAIVNADIVTTSVWANNLSKIAPLLADALIARRAARRPRLNVLACENAMFASSTLRKEILASGRGLSESQLDELAAFPNTAVDRVVLAGNQGGTQTVDVADYFELAVERGALVHPDQPPIHGATYVEDLESYLVRKLYVVNCGHLWAGLLGTLHGIENVREVFTSEELVRGVREAMAQAAAYVRQRFGFDEQTMNDYVDLSVRRYQCPGVDYNTSMITRSPLRKLAPDDRFVGPARGCEQLGLDNDRLLEGIAMLLLVEGDTDEQAVELQNRISVNGPGEALEHYSGIPAGTRMHQAIISHYHRLRHEYGRQPATPSPPMTGKAMPAVTTETTTSGKDA